MQNSKKTFIAGLNSDDSFFAHKAEDNVDALNARVISSSEGKSGSLSNIVGNRLIQNPELLFGGGDNKVIGTYEDPTTNNVFYFVTKTSGYSYIFMYDAEAEGIYKVLEDANLVGTYPLNFQVLEPITAVSFIDGLLYWSGVKDREPCRVNVERGIKLNTPGYISSETAYEQPIKKEVITVIRKPPMMPLGIRVDLDASRDTSFLKSRTLTFSYRYVYKDGEISVFAPTTPHYPNQDMDNLDHKTTKKIIVGFPLNEATPTGIADDIEKIQFAVKFDRDTSYFVWKEFTRSSHSAEFNSQTDGVPFVIKGDYYNDVLGSAVDDSNSIKLYDTVPYEAQALEIGRNRLFLGNFKEGLVNTRKMTSLDMSVSMQTAPFSISTFNQEIRDRGGLVGYSSSSAYQVGLAFFDFAGRTAGVLTDDSMKVITNERGLVYTTYNSFIDYSINTSASELIPSWATHYSILRTKNLTKDFTIGNLSDKIRYYQFDSTGNFTVRLEKVDAQGDPTGKFSDNEFTSFDAKHEGIAIGLGDLTSYKQGYSYQEGDRIKLITDAKVMEFSVTGTMGKYVLVNLVDINSGDYLGATTLQSTDYSVVYEIYSPHKIQPNEFYYESVRGRILNPGTVSPSFDILTGRLIGDVYMKSRSADMSTVPPHFVEGSARSDNAHSDPFKGNHKYIGFAYFHGTGLNDMTSNSQLGGYTGGDDRRFEVKITSTSGSADQFQWRSRTSSQRMSNPAFSSTTTITGNAQALSNGVEITFAATQGHTLGDRWAVNAKTQGTGLGNVNSKTYSMITSPPNGGIQAGSEVELHQKEYQNKTWIEGGDDHHEWTVTMSQSEITENYATIEEFFWESSFGSKICAAHPDNGIYFRRSTIDLSGDNGKNRMYILDSEANNNTPTNVSTSDGTLVHMIVRSHLTQNNDVEAKVDTRHDFRVDLPDEYGYSAESMNPSDDYFLNWIQITGRPNLVPDDVSAQNKLTGIAFSETKIPGSKVNGLSKFSALDEDRLDDATGPLRVLTMTSKTQSTGTVMLAISENETTSIYLGESQLQQASSGSQFLSVSKGVIGTKNALQGSYGTIHPESVVVNDGRAYWYDLKNQTVIKYDANGLKAIGDVKMKSYFREKSKIIVSDTIDNFIPATYDAYNNEYIITMPQTGEVESTSDVNGEFPKEPILSGSNKTPGGGFHTGDLNVYINGFKNPINQSIGINNGVGKVGFTAPSGFKLTAPVITSPNPKQQMTVTNAAIGGFTIDSNDALLHLPGVGALDFDKVPNGTTRIDLTLTKVTIVPPSTSVLVDNPLNFSSKFKGGFNTTPIRLVEPTYSGITNETKSYDALSGTLTIPFTSNFNFKLGDTNPNTGFTYTKNGVTTAIPIANISSNATALGSNSSLHYYIAGSWNLIITGIDSDTTKVEINSRKLDDPVITTVNGTNITTTSFNMLGELESSGTGTVQERGFVYSSTNQILTIANSTKCVDSATTVGVFEKGISGLNSSTIYYFRAYVITELGTTYANTRSVTTGSASNNTSTVVTDAYNVKINKAEGSIEADGGAPITRFGFVIGENNQPVVGQSNIINKGFNVTNENPITAFPHSFEIEFQAVTELKSDTTYYYRAYATNNVGVGYGVIENFATPQATVGGVALVELTSSTVSSSGGSVNFRVTKAFNSVGQVTGTIQIQDNLGAKTDVSIAIPSDASSEVVSVNVARNPNRTARTIVFSVEKFIPANLNQTGDNIPLLIKNSVSQPGSSGGGTGGNNQLEEKY